jgi:hypothetical protein
MRRDLGRTLHSYADWTGGGGGVGICKKKYKCAERGEFCFFFRTVYKCGIFIFSLMWKAACERVVERRKKIYIPASYCEKERGRRRGKKGARREVEGRRGEE